MRTFALVVLMLMLSVVLLAGFVITTAGAETPGAAQAATMDVTCDPATVHEKTNTLVTCTYVVHNTGSERLSSLAIGFSPSNSAPPPDMYFFFSETIDGVGQRISGSDLLYQLGDLNSGGVRTMELRTIVRSAREFAADAVLLAGPNQTELARYTIDRKTDSDSPRYMPVKFFSETNEASFSSPRSASREVVYALRLMDGYDTQFDNVSIELASTGDWQLQSSEGWTREGPTNLHTRFIGVVRPGSSNDLTLTFAPPAGATCATIMPVVLIQASFLGTTFTQPVFADSTTLGMCGGGESGSGQPSTLVDGGFGADATGAGLPPFAPLLLMALGCGLVRAGMTLRRHAAGGR